MGHCNINIIVKLEKVVKDLDIKNPNDKFFCDIYCQGRQT